MTVEFPPPATAETSGSPEAPNRWIKVMDFEVPGHKPEAFLSMPDESLVVPHFRGEDGLARVVLVSRSAPALGAGESAITVLSAAQVKDDDPTTARDPVSTAYAALHKIAPRDRTDVQEELSGMELIELGEISPWEKYANFRSKMMRCEFKGWDVDYVEGFDPGDPKTNSILPLTEAEFEAMIDSQEIVDLRTICAVRLTFSSLRAPTPDPALADHPEVKRLIELQEPKEVEGAVYRESTSPYFPDGIVDGDRVIQNQPPARGYGLIRNAGGSPESVILIRETSRARRDGNVHEILIGATGSVKPGEDPVQAAARELREESGYTAFIDQDPEDDDTGHGGVPKPRPLAPGTLKLNSGVEQLVMYMHGPGNSFAFNVVGKPGKRGGEEDEDADEVVIPFWLIRDHLPELVRLGVFSDAATIADLYSLVRSERRSAL